MTQRYDALVARTDKNGKTWWTKIGSLFPAKDGPGFTLMLDALPLTGADGQAKIVMRVPKPKGEQGSAPPANEPHDDMGGDNIPF